MLMLSEPPASASLLEPPIIYCADVDIVWDNELEDPVATVVGCSTKLCLNDLCTCHKKRKRQERGFARRGRGVPRGRGLQLVLPPGVEDEAARILADHDAEPEAPGSLFDNVFVEAEQAEVAEAKRLDPIIMQNSEGGEEHGPGECGLPHMRERMLKDVKCEPIDEDDAIANVLYQRLHQQALGSTELVGTSSSDTGNGLHVAQSIERVAGFSSAEIERCMVIWCDAMLGFARACSAIAQNLEPARGTISLVRCVDKPLHREHDGDPSSDSGDSGVDIAQTTMSRLGWVFWERLQRGQWKDGAWVGRFVELDRQRRVKYSPPTGKQVMQGIEIIVPDTKVAMVKCTAAFRPDMPTDFLCMFTYAQTLGQRLSDCSEYSSVGVDDACKLCNLPVRPVGAMRRECMQGVRCAIPSTARGLPARALPAVRILRY